MIETIQAAVEATEFDATFTISIDALRSTSIGDLRNVIKQVDWTLTGAQDGQSFALPQTTTLATHHRHPVAVGQPAPGLSM